MASVRIASVFSVFSLLLVVASGQNQRVTIADTNVIYWQLLPATNGVRYGCSRPVEDTSVFHNCETDASTTPDGHSGMSQAKCECVSSPNSLYITCYKDGKWYPSILDACKEPDKVTQAPEKQSSGGSTRISSAFILSIIMLLIKNF